MLSDALEVTSSSKTWCDSAPNSNPNPNPEHNPNPNPNPTHNPNPNPNPKPNPHPAQTVVEFVWVGDPLLRNSSRIFYRAVKLVHVDQVTVRVKDCVRVRAPNSTVPWVARLLGLWEDLRNGQKFMRTQWFLKGGAASTARNLPAHVKQKIKAMKTGLVLTEQVDDNSLFSLLGPTIVVASEDELAVAQRTHASAYLCNLQYNALTQELTELHPRTNLCNVLPRVTLEAMRLDPQLLDQALGCVSASAASNTKHSSLGYDLMEFVGHRSREPVRVTARDKDTVSKSRNRTRGVSEVPRKKYREEIIDGENRKHRVSSVSMPCKSQSTPQGVGTFSSRILGCLLRPRGKRCVRIGPKYQATISCTGDDDEQHSTAGHHTWSALRCPQQLVDEFMRRVRETISKVAEDQALRVLHDTGYDVDLALRRLRADLSLLCSTRPWTRQQVDILCDMHAACMQDFLQRSEVAETEDRALAYAHAFTDIAQALGRTECEVIEFFHNELLCWKAQRYAQIHRRGFEHEDELAWAEIDMSDFVEGYPDEASLSDRQPGIDVELHDSDIQSVADDFVL